MTEKEIVQTLRCCAEIGECEKCVIDPEASWEVCRKRDAEAADLIERLIAENTALREKQRWLPVTERLPEQEGSYIVRTASGSVTIVTFYPEFERFQRIFTHWMPLPEAPEVGL